MVSRPDTSDLAAQNMAPLHVSMDKLPAGKTPSRCLRPRKTVNYREQHCEDDEDVIVVEPPEAVVERSSPVFETFTSNIEIKDGLHLIRSLGGGKYETVNLSDVNKNFIASEEIGRSISSVPERHYLFGKLKEDFNEVRNKCEMAIDSADLRIFRFLKLPIELRYKVYDLCLMSSEGFCPTRSYYRPSLKLSIMQSCRQLYQETRPFFYRNTFNLQAKYMGDLDSRPGFLDHVQIVKYLWRGSRQDINSFKALANSFPQLKALHIEFDSNLACRASDNSKSKLFQNDPSIRKFSRAYGFDKLVQIRGLEEVKVPYPFGNESVTSHFWRSKITPSETTSFEAFLASLLTQPKSIPTALTRSQSMYST